MTNRWPCMVVTMLCCAWPVASYGAAGWYLLIPPRSEYNERARYWSGYTILDNKPLSQWEQQGAYDSVSECEAGRNGLLKLTNKVHYENLQGYFKAVRAGTDPAELKTLRWTSEISSADERAVIASRCIGNDDPRLR